MCRTKMLVTLFLTFTAVLLMAVAQASAFCGFQVAKADTALFNEASKVVSRLGVVFASRHKPARQSRAPATEGCWMASDFARASSDRSLRSP